LTASCCTGPFDRGREHLQLGSLFGLAQILAQACGLALGLDKFARQRAAVLRRGLRPRFGYGRESGFGLVGSALLHGEVLLHFDQRLKKFKVARFRARRTSIEILTDLDPVLEHRQNCLKLGHRRIDGGEFGLLLLLLTITRGELGTVLVVLLDQKLPLYRNRCRACILGRMKGVRRVGFLAERRRKPRVIELGGGEVALKVPALGVVHRPRGLWLLH
jgi:hypothetical protein